MSIASQEAQKQLDRIVALGYPDVADMSAAAFRALARPLIHALEHTDLGSNILLIPTRELVSPESLIARTSINRMAGFTTMPPRDIASFLPQDGFEPPEGPFYLVVEPHTGTCYINREPDVARKLIDSDTEFRWSACLSPSLGRRTVTHLGVTDGCLVFPDM